MKENRFGLVGRDISYSFSKGYFTEKFEKLGLSHHSYENFHLEDISKLEALLQSPNIKGLNVTIPYKEEVIPFMSKLDPKAAEIGAVNTIKFVENGYIGYNTDAYGFEETLKPLLKNHHKKALILGTGGASKAIAFVLTSLGIRFSHVSRKARKGHFTYDELDDGLISGHKLIVNCTPLGTHPHIHDKPNIPFDGLGPQHMLYDLIYNPEKTSFLKEGEKKGATIQNGRRMLELQAERSWQIWNL